MYTYYVYCIMRTARQWYTNVYIYSPGRYIYSCTTCTGVAIDGFRMRAVQPFTNTRVYARRISDRSRVQTRCRNNRGVQCVITTSISRPPSLSFLLPPRPFFIVMSPSSPLSIGFPPIVRTRERYSHVRVLLDISLNCHTHTHTPTHTHISTR
jgi:hypothetical protein